MMNRVASHRGASTSSSRVQRFGGSLSRSAPPRWIACGSENNESARYRLDSKQPTLEELTSFSPSLSSLRIKLDGEEIIPPISESTMWEARPGEILINTPHATRARITPVSLHLKGRPFDHDPSTADDSEYYLVDLERRYSKEWPSIEIRDGTVIFRRGFLEPLEDPQLPYRILYSGLERFTYNGSEKAMMTGITTALVAVHAAAFMALASWQPSLAVAVVVSWLRNSLSLVRWACLFVLASMDKVWIFWALLAFKLVDQQVEKLSYKLHQICWIVFKAWILLNVFSTSFTSPLPFWPFHHGAEGLWGYPYPIPRMN